MCGTAPRVAFVLGSPEPATEQQVSVRKRAAERVWELPSGRSAANLSWLQVENRVGAEGSRCGVVHVEQVRRRVVYRGVGAKTQLRHTLRSVVLSARLLRHPCSLRREPPASVGLWSETRDTIVPSIPRAASCRQVAGAIPAWRSIACLPARRLPAPGRNRSRRRTRLYGPGRCRCRSEVLRFCRNQCTAMRKRAGS